MTPDSTHTPCPDCGDELFVVAYEPNGVVRSDFVVECATCQTIIGELEEETIDKRVFSEHGIADVVGITVYKEPDEEPFGTADEHRPDLPKFNGALQEWVRDTFTDVEDGEVGQVARMVYIPNERVLYFERTDEQ